MFDLTALGKATLAHYATGAVLAVCLGRFVAVHELGMPEALVYMTIGLLIVGHWSFSAWLRMKQAAVDANPETLSKFQAKIEELEEAQEDTDKTLASMQTRLNATSVRMGFTAQ